MSILNILDLNDDCLAYLLNHLTIEDHISFAQVCCRFREIFINWIGKRYRQYTIDKSSSRLNLIEFCICRETVESLIIDLDYFDTALISRIHGCKTPVNCLSILCLTLEGMVNLKRLVVKQLQYILTPIPKPYEQILAGVKGLKELRILEMRAKDDWTYDNLCQLSHLEELYLHIQRIETAVLVKCCKSNPNLRILHLGYASVKRNLGDIVPHCSNLETLKFGMMWGPAAYKPLAKLPKLRQLIHSGVRQSGSFVPLLTALAARTKLRVLQIDGGSLSPEEMLQVVRLSRLQQLKCFCSTAECLAMLAQLTQLKELSIWMSSRCDISAALLKILGECKQLQLLRIAAGNLSSHFIGDASKLLLEIRSVPAQQPLQLELPLSDKLPARSEVLNCLTFESAFWNL